MFQTYIKAVGTGPKGNRDLSFSEAKDAMHQMLTQGVARELSSAFLLGWRLKPESVEEFTGALGAIDALSVKFEVKNSLELGYAFDGKSKTPYLLPLISKILQKSELQLVLTGDEIQPSKSGYTTKELVNAEVLPSNVHFFDRTEYCPLLHEFTQLRQILTLRTALNTLEKLPNISGSAFAITGVHHKPYVKKYQEIFANRYQRFALIQGSEGSPELFKKGMLWLCEDGKTTEYSIDPLALNIQKEDLEGVAKLNAAIWLFVADRFASIEEAFAWLSA